jgi:hypothetical protein
MVPNILTSLQTTLTAEEHLAEPQTLVQRQTLNTKKKFLIFREGTGRPTIATKH